MKKISKAFVKWLDEKQLTTEQFANECGISYNTVVKWRHDVMPAPFVKQTLKEKFPDCPLFV